jgi:hypothetical protein
MFEAAVCQLVQSRLSKWVPARLITPAFKSPKGSLMISIRSVFAFIVIFSGVECRETLRGRESNR